MTLNTTSKFQTLLGKALTYFILLSCFVILGLYAVQRFGAQYAEQKIREQLEHAGLTSFVHYQQVYFNPFTLTPSLEGVKVGLEDSPLLIFARISFNSYVIKHPNLDIDFWIQESHIDSLSRETRGLMRSAGIDTLLGKGSFSSTVQNEEITSELKLDIKDIGKLTLLSNIQRLDRSFPLSDLRSDILASFALGQPEALPIIYGDAIRFRSLDIKIPRSWVNSSSLSCGQRRSKGSNKRAGYLDVSKSSTRLSACWLARSQPNFNGPRNIFRNP